jgi:hypothetical protein
MTASIIKVIIMLGYMIVNSVLQIQILYHVLPPPVCITGLTLPLHTILYATQSVMFILTKHRTQ